MKQEGKIPTAEEARNLTDDTIIAADTALISKIVDLINETAKECEYQTTLILTADEYKSVKRVGEMLKEVGYKVSWSALNDGRNGTDYSIWFSWANK